MDARNEELRLANEREFWDRHARSIWGGRTNYRMVRILAFAELCEAMSYLLPVREFFGDLQGKRILDLACGDGWISWSLAKSGAFVTGCDISVKSIEIGTLIAQENGLSSHLKFDAMVCEDLGYKDNCFDCVIMHAALHHCNIAKTVRQIRRVLKPGGKAALIEDYAYHPLMNLYRRLTPYKHTETEEALSDHDVQEIVSNFSEYEIKYFGIVNLAEGYRNSLIRLFQPVLRGVDQYLYSHFPDIKRYSKLVEILLIK